MRGKTQLLYNGQPYIYEKVINNQDGSERKFWRCNQWWNHKCRARLFTVQNRIRHLNKVHTHSDVIKRKRRVVRKKPIAQVEDAVVQSTIVFIP